MKILILGAGTVGSTAAESLSEENEITVVDLNGRHLRELQDRLDIRTVEGHASHPGARAGRRRRRRHPRALTDSDETNMIACQIAYSLYRTPVRIARIRAASTPPARSCSAPRPSPWTPSSARNSWSPSTSSS
jgi:trk system potassium uptake protein